MKAFIKMSLKNPRPKNSKKQWNNLKDSYDQWKTSKKSQFKESKDQSRNPLDFKDPLTILKNLRSRTLGIKEKIPKKSMFKRL